MAKKIAFSGLKIGQGLLAWVHPHTNMGEHPTSPPSGMEGREELITQGFRGPFCRTTNFWTARIIVYKERVRGLLRWR